MFSLSSLRSVGLATVNAAQATVNVGKATARLAGKTVTAVGTGVQKTVQTGCTVASYAVPHNTKVAAFAAGCGFYAKGVATTEGTRILTNLAIRTTVREFGPIIGVKAATQLGIYGVAPFVVPPALPYVIGGAVLASTLGGTVVGNVVSKLAQGSAKKTEAPEVKKSSEPVEDIEANWDGAIEGTADKWVVFENDGKEVVEDFTSGQG